MQRLFFLVVVLCLVSSCGNVYYIVRHAEKATPSPGLTMTTPGDPALSREGELRAKALAGLLKNKNIGRIFTTNTIRTKATAAPVAAYFNIQPELYSPAEEGFITKKAAYAHCWSQ